MMATFEIKQIDDCFAIYHKGHRLDWPLLPTRKEAEVEMADFIKLDGGDDLDRSEARGLAAMAGDMEGGWR